MAAYFSYLRMALALNKRIFLCSAVKEEFSLKNELSYGEGVIIIEIREK